MTGKKRDHDTELARLEDALLADLMARSDDEVLAEASEEYGNAGVEATRVRELIAKTLNQAGKSKLEAARAAIRVAAQARAKSAVVSGSFEEKRRLLMAVVAAQKATGRPITLAARNADELTEADVDSMLEDLRDLGLINEDGTPK